MHSRFSPSSLSRVKACPPSFFGKYNIESSFASEGTNFAEVAERFAKGELLIEDAPSEFREYLEEYDEILDRYSLTLSSKVHVEEFLGTSEDGGTPDICGVAIPYQDNHGVVIDIKFGVGVEVEAVGNLQLMSYARNLLDRYPELETFTLVIWQPRGDFESEKVWNVTRAEVEEFRDKTLPQIKEAVMDSEGDSGFSEGSHCQFCPRKLNCPLKINPTNEVIALTSEKQVLDLNIEQISFIVQNESRIKSVLNDAKALVRQELSKGTIEPEDCGMKLVETKGNRKWEDKAEAKLKRKFGVDAVIEKKLKSPAQLEKHLKSKGELDEKTKKYLDDKTERPPRISMVSISKKGEHVAKIKEDFTDYVE